LKVIIKNTVLVFLIATSFWSCRELPEYPVTPSIEYKSVFYRETDTTNLLTIEIDFRDGDGDLGLNSKNPADVSEPYNAIWHFQKDDGSLLTYADRNTPPYDTFLPNYEYPYSCLNYSIEQPDTFYIESNPDHFNIFINFYVKKNGEFALFDWITWNPPNCGESYNGRFPILNESGQNRPLEGTLKYDMAGLGFEVIFKRDTLKLEIQIQDRALHRSNTVETPEFVINNIKIN